MWHNHFATAQSKVEDLALMRRQNEAFRRMARAPFGDLLNVSVREPALLLYLDAPSNRQDHPNENLARELLELFTLGIGNFTEADVKEAARALTGWTVEDRAFREVPSKHDDHEKTLFGRRGRFTAADLLAILLDRPATARRISRKICALLMGEGAVDEPGIIALADELTHHRLDIGHAVEMVLRSSAFFAAGNIGSRVVGPVEFVIGACRALIPAASMPSTLLLADWTARLGQELFEPPNVGGWLEGRAWLTSRSLVGRTNFAVALVEGRPIGLPPLDAGSIASAQGLGRSARDVREAALALLSGIESRASGGAGAESTPEAARRSLATVLASPLAQIG
jgi:uncharacterized protein (DUF1800 family)